MSGHGVRYVYDCHNRISVEVRLGCLWKSSRVSTKVRICMSKQEAYQGQHMVTMEIRVTKVRIGCLERSGYTV